MVRKQYPIPGSARDAVRQMHSAVHANMSEIRVLGKSKGKKGKILEHASSDEDKE